MPQASEISEETYRARIRRLQEAMNQFDLKAVVIEPGPAMMYLTGVRWGRSERTFAVVLPWKGEPAFVLPGFEERRARELIHGGADIRVWQEEESPYAKIVQVLHDRGIAQGRIGIEDTVRFFVFDGVRREAPKLTYVSAQPVLQGAP